MKELFSVRISSIEIRDLKNVGYGKVSLINNKYPGSILGLYGQNGSGKTTLINALQILKIILCGNGLPPNCVNFIRAGATEAFLSFEFLLTGIENPSKAIKATYSFSISSQGVLTQDNQENKRIPLISNETLKFSLKDTKDPSKNQIMRTVISTSDSQILKPHQQLKNISQNNKEVITKLGNIRFLAERTGMSFIFCKDFKELIASIPTNDLLFSLINSLFSFSILSLFVITTKEFNLTSTNILLISFKKGVERGTLVGSFPIPLQSNIKIPERILSDFESIISSMNIVLSSLIPNLKIEVNRLNEFTDEKGEKAYNIEVLSVRKAVKIPLEYESDGIKKIISVLQLLIYAYNSKNITVAIDEFDSGIFEYLLGELMNIFSSRARGQLIFTSHNLRPLETMDKNFVVFTTVNEMNRYIRPSNIKTNHNLRDTYFREILINNSENAVYQATDSSAIELALVKAGKIAEK